MIIRRDLYPISYDQFSIILEALQYYNQKMNKVKVLLQTHPIDEVRLYNKVRDILRWEGEGQRCWMVYDYFLTFLQYKLSDYPFFIEKINQIKLEHYQVAGKNQDLLQQRFEVDIKLIAEMLSNKKIHPKVCIQLIFYYKKTILNPIIFNANLQHFLDTVNDNEKNINENLIEWLYEQDVTGIHQAISSHKVHSWLETFSTTASQIFTFLNQHKTLIIILSLLLMSVSIRAEDKLIQTEEVDDNSSILTTSSFPDFGQTYNEAIIYYGLNNTASSIHLPLLANEIQTTGIVEVINDATIRISVTPSSSDNYSIVIPRITPLLDSQQRVQGKLISRGIELFLNSQQALEIVITSDEARLPKVEEIVFSDAKIRPKGIMLEAEFDSQKRLDLSMFNFVKFMDRLKGFYPYHLEENSIMIASNKLNPKENFVSILHEIVLRIDYSQKNKIFFTLKGLEYVLRLNYRSELPSQLFNTYPAFLQWLKDDPERTKQLMQTEFYTFLAKLNIQHNRRLSKKNIIFNFPNVSCNNTLTRDEANRIALRYRDGTEFPNLSTKEVDGIHYAVRERSKAINLNLMPKDIKNALDIRYFFPLKKPHYLVHLKDKNIIDCSQYGSPENSFALLAENTARFTSSIIAAPLQCKEMLVDLGPGIHEMDLGNKDCQIKIVPDNYSSLVIKNAYLPKLLLIFPVSNLNILIKVDSNSSTVILLAPYFIDVKFIGHNGLSLHQSLRNTYQSASFSFYGVYGNMILQDNLSFMTWIFHVLTIPIYLGAIVGAINYETDITSRKKVISRAKTQRVINAKWLGMIEKYTILSANFSILPVNLALKLKPSDLIFPLPIVRTRFQNTKAIIRFTAQLLEALIKKNNVFYFSYYFVLATRFFSGKNLEFWFESLLHVTNANTIHFELINQLVSISFRDQQIKENYFELIIRLVFILLKEQCIKTKAQELLFAIGRKLTFQLDCKFHALYFLFLADKATSFLKVEHIIFPANAINSTKKVIMDHVFDVSNNFLIVLKEFQNDSLYASLVPEVACKFIRLLLDKFQTLHLSKKCKIKLYKECHQFLQLIPYDYPYVKSLLEDIPKLKNDDSYSRKSIQPLSHGNFFRPEASAVFALNPSDKEQVLKVRPPGLFHE